MAARAYWKGFVKISLVSFPVSLFATTSSSSRVAFHQVHKETKRRIKLVPHDTELGPVDRAELVKGYEYEKGKYVIVDPEELETLKFETNKTVEIEKFVPADSIDGLYSDGNYYVAPDGAVAEESFRVFAEAMRRKKVIALGRIVLSGRERIAALKPRGPGMVLTTLRYGKELRSETAVFEDIKEEAPNKNLLELAEKLVEQNLGDFDPDEYSDRYGDAVLELVKSKLEGRPAAFAEDAPQAANIVSLMDALKQSVEDTEGQNGAKEKKVPAKAAKAPAKSAAKVPAKRRAARKAAG